MYDVIVIGAGPSGSFSAINLAKAGLSVLVIEKAQFPRVKLCGGGISPRANSLVSKVIDLDEYDAIKITSTFAAFKNKKLLRVGPHEAGYSIERSKFDQILLNKAIELGADVEMPAEVNSINEKSDQVEVILKNKKILRSKYLILAEGANGKLHKQLGYLGQRQNTMALEMNVYPDKPLPNLKQRLYFDFGAIPKGYAWLFPKNGYLNAGAYYYNTQSISKEKREYLYNFLNQFEWNKVAKHGQLKGYPIPRKILFNKYNTARTMIIGDVCGTAENMFGEGIYLGLYSGWAAAEVLLDSINDKTSIDYYSTVVLKIINKKLKYARILAKLFYNRQQFGFNFLIMNSRINNLYQQYISGSLPSKKLFYTILFKLPFLRLSNTLKEEKLEVVGLSSKE